MLNLLTIDVEEYYHVGRPGEGPDGEERRRLPSRVEEDVSRVLDLLDRRRTRATFFVLGESALAHPGAVRSIAAAGHEVASHGFQHIPVDALERSAFESDLDRSLEILTSIAGARPAGYRAPIWSLHRATWGLDALVSRGFAYDSSAAPVPPLGTAGLPHRISVLPAAAGGGLLEIPPLTGRFGPWRYPVGFALGLRSLPARFIRRAVELENRAGFPALLAFHTWELDPDPPVLRLSPSLALAHGFGLQGLGAKLDHLLGSLELSPVREHAAARQLSKEAA